MEQYFSRITSVISMFIGITLSTFCLSDEDNTEPLFSCDRPPPEHRTVVGMHCVYYYSADDGLIMDGRYAYFSISNELLFGFSFIDTEPERTVHGWTENVSVKEKANFNLGMMAYRGLGQIRNMASAYQYFDAEKEKRGHYEGFANRLQTRILQESLYKLGFLGNGDKHVEPPKFFGRSGTTSTTNFVFASR